MAKGLLGEQNIKNNLVLIFNFTLYKGSYLSLQGIKENKSKINWPLLIRLDLVNTIAFYSGRNN